MDQETISRKEKIEMARKESERLDFSYRKLYPNYQKEDSQGKESEHGYFFLRVLLSSFLLLAVLGVTKFEAMGKEQSQEYQTKLVHILKTQSGIDHIKEFLKSVK